MNTSFKWLATRAAPVLGAALIALAWAYGRDGGAGIPTVGGPEALRRELWLTQARALPAGAGPVTVDAGPRVYTGDEGADALALAEGLVSVAGAGGAAVWPVTLYEDGETRETVFLNADGQEAGRLPPPVGYDPGWALEAAFPGGVPGGVAQEDYDPAAVALTVWLSSPEWLDVLDAGGSSRAAGRGDATGSGLAAAPGPVQKAEAGEAHAIYRDDRHSAGDTRTNATSAAVGRIHPPGGRTVFVDARSGNDIWSGRVRAVSEGDGPKQTIRAGLAVPAGGKRLVVGGGRYRENIDVKDLDVRVRIAGDVTLLRPAAERSAPPARATVPAVFAPTGEVARAGISRR